MISELFLNDQITDLYEEEMILLTMSVADVKNPESKSSTFSKTVKAPGTARNNLILKHIFNITNDNQFNPNTKSSALLIQGGAQVFEGYMQLIKIITLSDNQIEYEWMLYSSNQSLFTDMGDNLMTGNTTIEGAADPDKDLDLSHLDHTWTEVEQITSWTAPIGEGYVYPLIDYGFTTDGKTYDSTNLMPCVYLKELVDNIFEKYGYRYTSAFLNSDYFKRLVIPYSRYTPPLLTSLQLGDKESRAESTVLFEQQTSANFTVPFDDDTTGDNHDAGGNFNTATYTFTAPSSHQYVVGGAINGRVRFHATAIVTAAHVVALYLIIVKKNGTIIYQTFNQIDETLTLSSGADSISDFTLPYEVMVGPGLVPMATGDTITVEISGTYTLSASNVDCYVAADAGSYLSCKRKLPTIGYGETFPGNSILPIKTKQRDFLSDVLKLFNLYVDEDKDNSGYLLIEPRDDYYNLGRIVNWDDKLDRSQPVEIKPMSELDFKELKFKYKEDGDYWNKLFVDEYAEPYGTQTVIMNTDFVKATKEIEVMFSPTPLVQQVDLSSAVVPAIYSMNTSGVKSMMNTNVRILHYAGMITGNWDYTSPNIGASYTTYPYAGHLDNPFSATIDLGFGAPKKIYYFSPGDIQLTNNTLYGKFYRNYVNEITNINSKMMTAWFRLRPLDIATIRLYDTIYCDGAYWRINKAIDYNATIEDLTQVELLFQIDSPAFEPTQSIVDGTGEDQIDGVQTEMQKYGAYAEAPQGNDQRRLMFGNNYVANDARNIIMNGDGDNSVGSGAETIDMTGCTNCVVGPGCYNISMKNCSDIELASGLHDIVLMNCTVIEGDIESNSVYINNIQM